MTKEKRILSYFIGWFSLLIIICFVGIIKANALIADYKFMGVTIGNSFWLNPNTTTTGQTYAVVTPESALNYLVVDVCASIDDLSNLQPSSTGSLKFYKLYDLKSTGTVSGYTCKNARIFYEITAWDDAANGNYGINTGSLPIRNNTSYYVETRLNTFGFSNSIDLGDLTINNQNTIINGIDNIQSSITDTENNINSNIDDMESAIVDSNKETQDVIKDQFNSCVPSYNLLPITERNSTTSGIEYTASNNVITIKGTATSNAGLSINTGNPIKLKPGTYTFTVFGNANNVNFNLDFYDSNNSFWQTGTGSSTFTLGQESSLTFYSYINNNSTYNVSYQVQLVEGSSPKEFKPYGEETCSNKIDETNDKLDNISGALTDDSPIDMSGLEDSIGWLPPGPIDSILTLPLALFNSLSRNLSNKTCMTANLELPFVNKTLSLPCVKSLYDKIGITGTLFQTTGIVASCFILFNYLLALYKWVDDTLTLRENTMPGYYDDNWGGGA